MGGQAYDRCDLRFGNICSLFYRDIRGMNSVPKQIERPASPEHMDLYEALMEKSKENHSWWVANTAEFRTNERLPPAEGEKFTPR